MTRSLSWGVLRAALAWPASWLGVGTRASGQDEATTPIMAARAGPQRDGPALWADLPIGVMLHAPDGTIVDANPAARRLLGLTAGQLHSPDALDPRWRFVRTDGSVCPAPEHPAMRTLHGGRPLANEVLGVLAPDGELRWLQVSTALQRDLDGATRGVVVCLVDISEGQAPEAPESHGARIDSLTRLSSRQGVVDRLERAIAHARRHPAYGFAVLFLDFDRFKQVNDTLGFAAGDDLLCQIAVRLQQALRPGDAMARVESGLHMAARTGGDEFVVVLEGVREQLAVKAVAERLLADMAEPFNVGAHPVRSSVSIGIVCWQGQTGDAEDLLRSADTAMYEAKRAGRGRYVIFENSMHEHVAHTLAMESDLRQALLRDELLVVYQPMVDLATRTMSGVEALVRWQHPERGLLMPADFVGVAEECGLIDELGQSVLHQACEQFARWRATLGTAAPALLAVNLTRTQLRRKGLVDEVAKALAASGMPAHCLQLEFIESLSAQDERIQTTMRELKRLGVTLALDDFGTGYSSLACLHQLPVDAVKIDRSLVRHAETVEYQRVLIEATIRVARALGISTACEGLETPGQAELMQRLHCDGGQGALFGHPMTGAELAGWAERMVAAAQD